MNGEAQNRTPHNMIGDGIVTDSSIYRQKEGVCFQRNGRSLR